MIDTVKVIFSGRGARVTIHAIGAEPPLDEAYASWSATSRLAICTGVETIVGLLVLPFNVAHLGKAAYGLWILTTSITADFSVLDLGYREPWSSSWPTIERSET